MDGAQRDLARAAWDDLVSIERRHPAAAAMPETRYTDDHCPTASWSAPPPAITNLKRRDFRIVRPAHTDALELVP